MKPASLITIILVASVQSFDDFIFKKYAMLKIYEDCYGKDTVKGMSKEIQTAYSKCSGQTPKGAQLTMSDFAAAYSAMSPGLMTMMNNKKKPQMQPHRQQNHPPVIPYGGMYTYQMDQKPLPWVLPDYIAPAMQYNGYLPHQIYGNQDFRHQYPQPLTHQYHYEPFYTPFGSMRYRQKRQAQNTETLISEGSGASPTADDSLTLEKVEKMGKYMQARISNLTCVMKEIGFLTEDMKPDYESICRRVEKLPVADEVKIDLCFGVDSCKKFSECVPLDKYEKIPYLKDLAQPMVFFKCFQGKKLETCMKKDLREKFSDVMDETMMTMARHSMTKSSIMADDDTGGARENTIDNIFNMIYGFNMASSTVDDIF